MPRESKKRRQERRLRRLLQCLGRKNFVMIPVVFRDYLLEWPQGKKFLDSVLAAGAVEVIHGRVPESNLKAALGAEICAGHLPEDARNLVPHIDEISVFCHVCAEDIRNIIKTIEDEEIPNSGPLQVEHVFIGYKKFRKEILYLGMPHFECSSPRHLRLSPALLVEPCDSSPTDASTEVSLNLWDMLDEEVASYYKLDLKQTELFDTTYQELICTVYRLFVNKRFLLEHSSSLGDSEGNLGVCSSKYSMIIVILLKMLQRLKTRLRLHFSQPSGVLKKLVTGSNLCREELENTLLSVKEMDVDGSLSTFISDLELEWADIFQLTILSSSELQNELHESIFGMIERARSSWETDEDEELLRDAIGVLKGCSLFEHIVERPYLCSVSHYYSCLSRPLIRTLNAQEYLKTVESCVDKEVQLAMQFMGTEIGHEVTIRIVKEMVGDQMTRLVNDTDSHLCHLISVGSYSDISRLFKLVRTLPEGYASLSKALTNHMRRSLSALVADKEKPPIEYIQLILEERDKYERIIKRSLGKDMQLISKSCFILREISSENFQLSEYVSLYMDRILALERAECEAGDTDLDKAVTLVRDFDNSAAFEIFYQRHLADRLLSGRYHERMELSMLSKLRGHCCPHYLKKLEVMIFDIKTSQEVMSGFHQTQDATPICAQILTANFWPQRPFTVCSLPSEVMESLGLFCEYYVSQHPLRKLDWYPSLGDALISAKFGGCDREYELVLPMHHMSVLMLFNSADSLTFGEIQKRTCIPRAHLVRCLSSLTCVKGKNVLCKVPKGKITRKDQFYVNECFSSKIDKLKFDSVVTLKNAEVVLDNERSNVIDSVIIKMLKEKATTGLRFNSVVKGLSGLLKSKFRVTPRAVQRRLDSLTQWEYVKKEERDGVVYFRYNP